MRDIEKESFDQMCSRIAYQLMQGIARGDGAIHMAHSMAGSVLLWRRDQDELDKRTKKEAVK